MFANAFVTLAVIAVTIAVAWFTLRARRAPRPVAKWMGIVGGAVVGLILVFVSVTSARGMLMLYSPRGKPARDLKVELTPERVARGQHVANMWCAACHTLNGQLPLSGGKNLSDDAGMPLGDLYTINLTPAGPLATWTDGEIFRAVREGADNRRRRLLVMSAQRARNLSDDDLVAVVAFLRSQPPVQHETPPPRPSFLAVVMAGAGMLPYLPDLTRDTIFAPPPDTTLAYGAYVVTWTGCDECHGPQLTGGGGGVVPKAPSLRSVKNWSREGFITAMRTGKTPFGKQLDSVMMPWKFVGRGTDVELSAIYKYLVSLP